MKLGPLKRDAYVAFKNDRERRIALVSRDVRLAIIAIVASIASAPSIWPYIGALLR